MRRALLAIGLLLATAPAFAKMQAKPVEWTVGKERFSGTLFVHKACHHFDLLNWWIGSDPEMVYAQGALEPFLHHPIP